MNIFKKYFTLALILYYIKKNYPKAYITYYNYVYNNKKEFDNIFHFIAFYFIKFKFDALKFWNKNKYNEEISVLPFKALVMELDQKKQTKKELIYLDLIIELLSLLKSGILTIEEIILLLKTKYPDLKDKIDKIQSMLNKNEK